MRWVLAPVLLLGVGAAVWASAQPRDETQDQPAARLTGMDLITYNTDPAGEGTRPPTFRLRANEGVQVDDDIWELTGVTAAIYRLDGEPIRIQSVNARYDASAGEGNETAVMTGDVAVMSGEMTLRMDEIHWDNAKGLAWSDTPITIERGQDRAYAKRLRIRPHENKFILQNGRGRLPLSGTRP